MNTAFWLSIVLGVVGITGIFIAGKGKWQGWALGLAIQPVWFVFALVTEAYGLLLICFGYAFVYAKNLLQWRKELPSSKPTPAKEDRPRLYVVVAGTNEEALEFYRQINVSPYDSRVIIATSAEKLRGLRFTFDEVAFVGTWYKRKDIDEIMATVHQNSFITAGNTGVQSAETS